MRNNQQTPESAAAWARWLRDPDRSHNPNAYELIATLLDGLSAQVQEAERVCGEAYQVVGVLLQDLGIFDTERATKVLDNLSAAEQVHKDVLPWPCTQPMQPLVVGKHGVVRFKENRIVSAVLDVSHSKGYFGLNQIACGDYTPEERMQFAQLIGYSVSGYGDLSYASKESIAQADALAEALVAQKDPS